MRITAVIALCISLLGGRAVMAQTVAPVGVTPATVPVGQGTPVTVTAVITDPAVIAAACRLQRYDSQGRVVGVLGLLNDDGANGDAVAGDKTFSARPDGVRAGAGDLHDCGCRPPSRAACCGCCRRR